MALSDPKNTETPFGLLDSSNDETTQKFIYDSEALEIRLADDPKKCISVAENIIEAGPFQSRDLIYAPCDKLDKKFKQWLIRK
jgi:hypothetical protein